MKGNKLVEILPRRIKKLREEFNELNDIIDKEDQMYRASIKHLTDRRNKLFHLLQVATSKYKVGDKLQHRDGSKWLILTVNPCMFKEYEIQRIKKNGCYGQKKLIAWMDSYRKLA